MKSLALHAIRLYQRYLSPHKRFRCAYAAVSGHCSCSVLGYRAIRRFGVWRGLAVLDLRLHKCGVASRRQRIPAPAAALHGRRANQAGFIDCGGCDAPGCDMPTDACGDLLDCANCSGGCDWRRRRRHDDYVVIPVRGDCIGRPRCR